MEFSVWLTSGFQSLGFKVRSWGIRVCARRVRVREFSSIYPGTAVQRAASNVIILSSWEIFQFIVFWAVFRRDFDIPKGNIRCFRFHVALVRNILHTCEMGKPARERQAIREQKVLRTFEY